MVCSSSKHHDVTVPKSRVDPKDPHRALYDIDDQTTIFQLGEWYHGYSPDIFSIFQTTASIPSVYLSLQYVHYSLNRNEQHL